ncbi:hypothetical protein BDP27DRAFT_1361404 [Rhodocollybia butyracea]|uniref:Uncharacterized protein n=1 Tax=Rhodocollybia butyracea TaxID=206335 RepID=A0A9P5Q1P3_9AGAR|nr:hypothetical protein BDP27DRAFT_1361404 [Rhodocollybia butyracea]
MGFQHSLGIVVTIGKASVVNSHQGSFRKGLARKKYLRITRCPFQELVWLIKQTGLVSNFEVVVAFVELFLPIYFSAIYITNIVFETAVQTFRTLNDIARHSRHTAIVAAPQYVHTPSTPTQPLEDDTDRAHVHEPSNTLKPLADAEPTRPAAVQADSVPAVLSTIPLGIILSLSIQKRRAQVVHFRAYIDAILLHTFSKSSSGQDSRRSSCAVGNSLKRGPITAISTENIINIEATTPRFDVEIISESLLSGGSSSRYDHDNDNKSGSVEMMKKKNSFIGR